MNRFHIALDYAAGADPAPVFMWVVVVDQWIAVSQMSSATPIDADVDRDRLSTFSMDPSSPSVSCRLLCAVLLMGFELFHGPVVMTCRDAHEIGA